MRVATPGDRPDTTQGDRYRWTALTNTTFGILMATINSSIVAMFHLDLFRTRAFAAGNLAGLLSSIARGGLQFMMIIWLQGIWLPLHGYSFESTPLWAGIYLLPLTVGFLVAGPVSGWLSDRFGARPFATGGMLLAAGSFGLMELLPADFSYPVFALLLLVNGIGSGLFTAPNAAGIMNAVPAAERGVASGMGATFQNSGFVLSIGLFFSLMIAGLAGSLPQTMLLGPQVLGSLPPGKAAFLTGQSYFPGLISGPFGHGLRIVFTVAAALCVIAALASWMRGGRYVHAEQEDATMLSEAEESMSA